MPDFAEQRLAAERERELKAQHANTLLERFVIREFRSENAGTHLGECPDLAVADLDARDGSYGCDTGCEYLRLEASLTCPHEPHPTVVFTYGEFGDMSRLIEDLVRMEKEEGR